MENKDSDIEGNHNFHRNNCEICRLCLSQRKDNLLNALTDLELINKLNTFCKIIIVNDDHLPKTICSSCLNEINRFANFCNLIQDNQKLLLKKIVNVSSNEDLEVITVLDIVEKEDGEPETEDNSCDNDEYEDRDSEMLIEEEQSDKEDNSFDNHEYKKGNSEMIVEAETSSQENFQICNNTDKERSSNLTKSIAKFKNKDKSKEVDQTEDADCFKTICFKSGNEASMKKWLKNTFKNNKTKEKIRKILEECNKKSKFLILPSYKSNYRISLDEPIREFFDLNCHHCPYVFLTFATMRKHMEMEHKEQCFLICCNKKLYRREAIMEHINYHLNPNKFVCHVCQQVCKSKVTLKIHLKQHLPKDQRLYKCEKCEQSFALNSQLKNHEKSHLSDEEKKYVCEECGKAFAFKFVLEKHKQHMHIRQTNYMCEICAKSFVDKVNLIAHKRIHDNSLPRLQCPHCDMLLKNKVTLKVHMRTHNSINEAYSCSKCDKILSTKNALMNHLQYVHGGKQYVCTICQRVFKKALTLKEHMTRHTGEILYNCPYCEKTFKAKANKYSHVKKIHPKEWAEQRRLKWGMKFNNSI